MIFIFFFIIEIRSFIKYYFAYERGIQALNEKQNLWKGFRKS